MNLHGLGGDCDEGRVQDGGDENAARVLTGLVERDVAILADTTEEELNATVLLDLGLVLLALLDQVLRVPVQDVDLRGRDVDWVRGRRQVKADARRGLRDAPCEKNSRNIKVW